MMGKIPAILVIDDNPDNLTSIKAVLADSIQGVKVLTALDGETGIDLALSGNPDVILLDIIMPGVDGLSVCRQLKQDERVSHIPVIMLTALKTNRDIRIKALEAGAEAFLTKPFDEIELIAQLKAMVRIKELADMQRAEKSKLSSMVLARTLDLEKELAEHRKAKDELIVAKNKAEESDRLKSAFLANMSHEIRTPMNGIIGFSELLKETNLDTDERDRYVKIINDNCQQLLHIINDIIDISKIEAGLVELDTAGFSLDMMMDSLAGNCQKEVSLKGLEMILSKEPASLAYDIIADQTKLRQVMDNLLSNAIKFTKEGTIEFGYKLKKDKLEFFTKDTGIGIPEQHREAIFNRFWQVETGLARQYGGNGLGLSISNAFVKAMGGEIVVESTPGLGSCFSFSIPLARSDKKKCDDAVHETAPLDFSGTTILVVEDEPDNFSLMNIFLERLGFHVEHAWDGKEAMQIFHEQADISMVLMDFKLPDIPGQEITRMMLTLRPDLPVIATTAYAMHGDREKTFQSGCVGYLAKPIRFKELADTLNRFRK